MNAIRRTPALAVALGVMFCLPSTFAGQEPSTAKPAMAKPAAKPAAAQPKHVAVTPDQVKWGPAPPSLPPGAQAAVLDGDPSVAGKPFALRVKFPANYRVPPHFHPADENLVIISGALMVGMGDKIDEASVVTLSTGSFARVPRQMHHYALTKSETVLHLYGVGPFGVTYVNPKDDPRTGTK